MKYADFKNLQPRPWFFTIIFFYIRGTLFLLTSLCGTSEEVFSEFQPPHQCNVCLCVWCVLSVLAQHTPHTFFFNGLELWLGSMIFWSIIFYNSNVGLLPIFGGRPDIFIIYNNDNLVIIARFLVWWRWTYMTYT